MRPTYKQLRAMDNIYLSRPVPLAKADLSKSFVYQRGLGVFYVPFGHHPGAIAMLFALNNGFDNGIDACEALGLEYSQGATIRWLRETPGAAYKSSVGRRIRAGKIENMSAAELRYFADADFLCDGEED